MFLYDNIAVEANSLQDVLSPYRPYFTDEIPLEDGLSNSINTLNADLITGPEPYELLCYEPIQYKLMWFILAKFGVLPEVIPENFRVTFTDFIHNCNMQLGIIANLDREDKVAIEAEKDKLSTILEEFKENYHNWKESLTPEESNSLQWDKKSILNFVEEVHARECAQVRTFYFIQAINQMIAEPAKVLLLENVDKGSVEARDIENKVDAELTWKIVFNSLSFLESIKPLVIKEIEDYATDPILKNLSNPRGYPLVIISRDNEYLPNQVEDLVIKKLTDSLVQLLSPEATEALVQLLRDEAREVLFQDIHNEVENKVEELIKLNADNLNRLLPKTFIPLINNALAEIKNENVYTKNAKFFLLADSWEHEFEEWKNARHPSNAVLNVSDSLNS